VVLLGVVILGIGIRIGTGSPEAALEATLGRR
jgi:hypothetical protein